jgi:hypothetical protein
VGDRRTLRARRSIRLLGLYLGLVTVFVLLMTAVYVLPQASIIRNLQASMPTLNAEGQRPPPFGDNLAYQLDTATDAQMLDPAIVTRSNHPMLNAMAADRGGAGGLQQSPTAQLPGRLPFPVNTITALGASVAGNRGTSYHYATYWHGYEVVLRPALIVLDYTGIRWLNAALLLLLLVIVLTGLHRATGWQAPVALLIALLLTGTVVVPLCLAISPDYYVMLCAVLAVLELERRGNLARLDLELFLSIGMLTSFFALLANPLLTLGMPLIVVFIIRGKPERTEPPLANAALAVRLSVAWALGYAGAWIAKWFIGSAALQTNVIRNATAQVMYRLGVTSAQPHPLSGVKLNILIQVRSVLTPHPEQQPILILFVIAIVAIATWLLIKHRQPNATVASVLPVLLAVPLPYLWYLVTNQYSTSWCFIAYRVQAVAIFAITYVVLASIRWSAAAGVPARESGGDGGR